LRYGREVAQDSRVEAMSDGQLAALSRRGNGEAFSVLARRWNRPLRRFVARLLGVAAHAEDAGRPLDRKLRVMERVVSGSRCVTCAS
jgi:hypothetical protein